MFNHLADCDLPCGWCSLWLRRWCILLWRAPLRPRPCWCPARKRTGPPCPSPSCCPPRCSPPRCSGVPRCRHCSPCPHLPRPSLSGQGDQDWWIPIKVYLFMLNKSSIFVHLSICVFLSHSLSLSLSLSLYFCRSISDTTGQSCARCTFEWDHSMNRDWNHRVKIHTSTCAIWFLCIYRFQFQRNANSFFDVFATSQGNLEQWAQPWQEN